MRFIKQLDHTVIITGGGASQTKRFDLPLNMVAIWASNSADETPVACSLKTENLHADGSTYVVQDTIFTGAGTGLTDGAHFVVGAAANDLKLPVTTLEYITEPHGSNDTTFIVKILCLVEEIS